jgi:hypothetical protein
MQSRKAGVHYACSCTQPQVAAAHLWGFNKVFAWEGLTPGAVTSVFFLSDFYDQPVYSYT